MILINKIKIPKKEKALRVASAPAGVQALLVAHFAREHPGGVMHIARDDRHLDAMAEGLQFFAPDVGTLRFPSWDCLPYDRVSPNAEIAAERVATLSALATTANRSSPLVILTTASAVLQRVPPVAHVVASARTLAKGARFDLDTFVRFLAENGYARTGTVREPGEFGVRGGLIDLYPPGSAEPLRLDLFGNAIEAIRTFDPTTQRTTGHVDRVTLRPTGEFRLDADSIARFRGAYTSLFGVPSSDDGLYAAVCEGRRHAGMEHWLPLFHETLDTIFDYAPEAIVTLDPAADEARDRRAEMVEDYYDARRTRQAGTAAGGVYSPLSPDRLYLDVAEWNRRLGASAVARFTPFALPAAPDVVDAGGREGRDFGPERAKAGGNVFDAVRDYLVGTAAEGRRAMIACHTEGSRDRLGKLLAEHGIDRLAPVQSWREAMAVPANQITLAVVALEKGFVFDGSAIVTEQDILGDRIGRPPRRARRAENFIAEVTGLAPGDLVIHVDHGIGRFVGLQTIDIGYVPHDCLLLHYDGGDRLFVPVENLEMLSRYGSEDSGGTLDKLGGAAWQERKARVKKRLKDMAEELIRIAAVRTVHTVDSIVAMPGPYGEFCARFPYHETDDQRQSIADVLGDLATGRPMDRLVCGDVGFGKTEVALRSAFAVAMTGKQVAIVCPTTLLARQHFKTFATRFEGLPVHVAQLSRLVSAKDAIKVREGLANGEIDIVIGTHALLAKGVTFRDLGIVIVDEEQHFGVKHKERLKQFRANVHVLTLTATPIPRTLQLALSGVRELSLISTPPVDRLAIRTYTLPFDPVVVREAIQRERFRGGQIYYVCPRIADIPDAEDFLKREVPEIKYAIMHGHLPPTQLDSVMNAFYDGQFDVLLCTNIIESGLDIPNVNTLIVHRADMFGLAQLYQIRGRVGRSKVRAYAYLTLPANRAPTETAIKRLEVMQSLDGLGAGFSLASHDLDLRGAGNLLGEEQSGHIREVGLELYQQMLEEAVATARSTPAERAADSDAWSPLIQIGTAVLIPESYVGDLTLRMGLYRRLSRLASRAEIDAFAAELIDRFGPLPAGVEHLTKVVGIKHACLAAGIERIEAGPRGVSIVFRGNKFANPAGLVDFISRQGGAMKLRPDHRLVYLRDWDNVDVRLQGLYALVERVAAIASSGRAAGVTPVALRA
ncbi:MAG: transcription-repair coupling factor [Alphaproteobacteria bacterium]|nr:transcription-repair coupling factor [Alphaproteobacteria bacterium]